MQCVLMWFFDTMLIMHKPTNGKPDFSCFLFGLRDMAAIRIRKMGKRLYLAWKKGKEKWSAFRLCARTVQSTVRFQIEIVKIERGIGGMAFSQLVVVITWLIYGIEVWECFLMSRELGKENCIDLILVSSALFPLNFVLIGNDDFYTNWVWKS